MSQEFATTLLREKFVIRGRETGSKSAEIEQVTALSNRMKVELVDDEKDINESFVIRTQNMHSCVRMAAALCREFSERGSIVNRPRDFDWASAWRNIVKGFEADWNPEIWLAVYYKGRLVYQYGEHHPFLDIIEQCSVQEEIDYDSSVKLAEKIFDQAGKSVKIEHDQNVALVVSLTNELAKCGVIMRCADKTATFNFTVSSQNEESIEAYNLLSFSAAFLEGIQLAYMSGIISKKRSLELVEKFSDEDRKGNRCHERMANLNRAIYQFEDKYKVSYRPARPDFGEIVRKAEEAAMTMLKPQLAEMMLSKWID
jgi:hypothetical protein